jgi:hypothetical protein
MANFKVGDRVRVKWAAGIGADCTGCSATILHIPVPTGEPGDCTVLVDGHSATTRGFPVEWIRALFCQLEPLTPPAEDAWAADAVRKVTKPQPQAFPVPTAPIEYDRQIGGR